MIRDRLSLGLQAARRKLREFGRKPARRERLGDRATAWIINARGERDPAGDFPRGLSITATRVSSVAAGGRPCYSNQGEWMTPTPKSNPGQDELGRILDMQEVLTGRDEGRPTDEDLIEFARRDPPKGPWSLEVWHGSITPALLRLLAERLERSNRELSKWRRSLDAFVDTEELRKRARQASQGEEGGPQ